MSAANDNVTGPGQARRWTAFLVIAFAVLAADQVTKFQAVKHLTTVFEDVRARGLGQELEAFVRERQLTDRALPPRHVIRSFWSHRYAENPGAAWSFAANWPDNVRVPFFHVVSLLAILLIGYYYRKLEANQRLLGVALALVMGGALGNLADRLLRGYVIDFIDWHLNDPLWLAPSRHWPTFNVADAAITTGVVLIALDSVLVWWAGRKSAAAPTARTAD